MHLDSLRIQNFRAFEEETIRFTDYTCLVGPNGSGKSTVLTALNILFRQNAESPLDLLTLEREDFFQQDTSKTITITAVFTGLSTQAQKDLKDYYRHDRLVISAVACWDESTEAAVVEQHGERLVMPEFAPFFEAVKAGKKVDELRRLYAELRGNCPDLPSVSTKVDMRGALRSHEEAHPKQCNLLKSQDQFYGFSKGTNLLEKHLQWVCVPAVKDPTTEQLESRTSALGTLLARTVRSRVSFDDKLKDIEQNALGSYQTLLDEEQHTLDELSQSLRQRLRDWAHPEAGLTLLWDQDRQKRVTVAEPVAVIRVQEGDFKGRLARFGHGLQRSYLLALLSELAFSNDESQPALFLGCEEPELFQHPPQSRHLVSVFDRLSKRGSQVVVSTHSPIFVSGERYENVRLVRKTGQRQAATVTQLSYENVSHAISEALAKSPLSYSGTALRLQLALQPSVNEIFFTPVLILVEGIEDRAYITAHLTLSNKLEDFRRLGCHIVPTNGKGFMIEPLAIAKQLEIPTIVVCDADSHVQTTDQLERHKRENLAILRLTGHEDANPLPQETVWRRDLVMWSTEVGKVVQSDFGDDAWHKADNAVRAKHDLQISGISKSPLFIGYVLGELWDQGHRSETLDRLSETILNFAKSAKDRPGSTAETTHDGLRESVIIDHRRSGLRPNDIDTGHSIS